MIKCFGTVYRLHPLFVIMMALSVWLGCFLELITLFGIVMIHELGHAVAAKSYGWNISEIRLFPFGGVMVVEEQDLASSHQEIIVALCGPLQNVLMIAVAFTLQSLNVWEASWADYFIQANIWIALFNLIPVLPLDGGRIVQALLHRYLAYYRIIVSGAWVSMLISALIAVLAVLRYNGFGVNVNLMAVAIFLMVSNWYSYKHANYVFIRFLVGRENHSARALKHGYYAQPIVVRERYKSLDVVKLLIRERYHTIYIVRDDGSIRSVIPERQLIRKFLAGDRIEDDADTASEPPRVDLSSMVQ